MYTVEHEESNEWESQLMDEEMSKHTHIVKVPLLKRFIFLHSLIYQFLSAQSQDGRPCQCQKDWSIISIIPPYFSRIVIQCNPLESFFLFVSTFQVCYFNIIQSKWLESTPPSIVFFFPFSYLLIIIQICDSIKIWYYQVYTELFPFIRLPEQCKPTENSRHCIFLITSTAK